MQVRTAWLAASLLCCGVATRPAGAQSPDVGEVFRQVAPTVVVVRATGRDISGDRGEVTFLETGSGGSVAARVVASEPAADLSLLQLERLPTNARVARQVDSDSVINTGNSGGPMFNRQGQLIGVVSHNISKSGGSEGLGFVVTLNTARELLLERRSMWSGLEGRLLTDAMADVFNVPNRVRGYLVKTVARQSPAAAMGLRGGTRNAIIDGETLAIGGDIVLEVGGITINSAADLAKIRDRVRQLAPGAAFTATVLRAGAVVELTGQAPAP